MAKLKYILISFLIFNILFSNAISQSFSSSWIDGTPKLHEESQYLLNSIGIDNKQQLAPPLLIGNIDPAYKVGDIKKFYAINMQTNRQYILDASLYAVSDSAYIFVEKNNPLPLDKIKALLESFDDIYNNVTKIFGDPPNRVDNDTRVYVLIMDIVDGALPNGVRILGYFCPIDQFRNIELSPWTRRKSNEVDMLYIDSLSISSNQVDAKSVIAHELTHLIQWGKDPKESIWVDEGIAVYAESVLGYNVKDRISAYEKKPNISLRNWNDTIEDYGSAYLFFAYISERFGGTKAVTDIMNNKEQDTIGIEKALSQLGQSVSFNDIFSDWVIANYLDNPNIYNGKYGYSMLDVSLKASAIESQYPIEQKSGKVLPWSAQYIKFQKANNEGLNLSFLDEGQDEIKSKVINIVNEGKIDILEFPTSEAKSKNIAIDSGNSEIIMVVTSQPDPPDQKQGSSVYFYSAETKIGNTTISVTPSGNKITTWGSIRKE